MPRVGWALDDDTLSADKLVVVTLDDDTFSADKLVVATFDDDAPSADKLVVYVVHEYRFVHGPSMRFVLIFEDISHALDSMEAFVFCAGKQTRLA